MSPKIKNIIIIAVIAIALIFVYFFFFKQDSQPALVSSSDAPSVVGNTNQSTNLSSPVNKDFLSTLLNIKNLKINVSIFSDASFTSLHDSSILIVPEGNEGRPNPFAPIGSDTVVNSNITPSPENINQSGSSATILSNDLSAPASGEIPPKTEASNKNTPSIPNDSTTSKLPKIN